MSNFVNYMELCMIIQCYYALLCFDIPGIIYMQVDQTYHLFSELSDDENNKQSMPRAAVFIALFT